MLEAQLDLDRGGADFEAEDIERLALGIEDGLYGVNFF
jgi:hypothetical protein